MYFITRSDGYPDFLQAISVNVRAWRLENSD